MHCFAFKRKIVRSLCRMNAMPWLSLYAPVPPGTCRTATVHGAPQAAHSDSMQNRRHWPCCVCRAVPCSWRAAVAHGHIGRIRPLRSSGCQRRSQCAKTKQQRHAPLQRANAHGMRHATPTARPARSAEGNGDRGHVGQCLRRATNLRDDEFGARDRVRCEKLVRLGRIEQLRVVAQLPAQHATWRSGQQRDEERGNLQLENSAASVGVRKACARWRPQYSCVQTRSPHPCAGEQAADPPGPLN